MSIRILTGDARTMLASLRPQSIQCAITSPPYYGLRSYETAPQIWGEDTMCEHDWQVSTVTLSSPPGSDLQAGNKGSDQFVSEHGTCTHCGAWRGHLGHEPDLDLFIDHLVEIFRGVYTVLRDDGVLWVNMGDSYASAWPSNRRNNIGAGSLGDGRRQSRPSRTPNGLKEKDLMMVPARLAIALQEDGWYLRSQLPWIKRNCMPESVKDRPTSAVEYIYLLTKRPKYCWYPEAVARVMVGSSAKRYDYAFGGPKLVALKSTDNRTAMVGEPDDDRNMRNTDFFFDSFGMILNEVGYPLALDANPTGYSGAHFATFPTRLVESMVLSTTLVGQTVLDPFAGSGTTGLVADRLDRDAVLIELSQEYSAMIHDRVYGDAPLFVQVALT